VNFELDHDLTAWADGTLSREDLITLHGQQGLALASLHERLLGAAEMEAPDPVAGWALLQRKMNAKVVPLRAGARPQLRRAVLAVAAALLIGGGALAAVRGVAFDHPGEVTPPAGSPASQGGTHESSPDRTGTAGATDGRVSGHQSSSTSAPTGGTDDPVGGSGSGSTGTSGSGDGTSGGDTSGDGTSTGDSGGVGTTQDPDGKHPGQGNGGEDNGNDGPHGHGGASSAYA
jgi:hypothetical protein